MSEPAGIIMPFAGRRLPAGYLPCDGSAVSRSTYATLFGVIGTTFGAGDGSSTFNLPDLSGRVPLGVSQSHALGTTGGSETVTLTEQELPAHVHEVPAHGHTHTITATTPKLTHSITTQPSFTYNKPNSVNVSRAVLTSQMRTVYNSNNTPNASISTNASITAHAATNCTMSGSVTNKAAFTCNNNGGNLSHVNMQPYIAINYIICTGVA